MQGLTKTLIPLFGLVAAPLAVQAATPQNDLSYNYLEAAYVFGDQVDVDDVGDFDLDGFRFKGSAALTQEVFVWGASHNLDVEDVVFDDTSVDTQSLGVGYRFPLVTGPGAVDLWGGLSYERLDVGTSANGYGATLGLRWLPIPEFELSGFAGYRDYGDLEYGSFIGDTEVDGAAYGVGAAYHVTNNLALLADWERWALDADPDGGGSTDVDVDAFSVGVRWNIR
jgi:hypothetical protein